MCLGFSKTELEQNCRVQTVLFTLHLLYHLQQLLHQVTVSRLFCRSSYFNI